MRNSNERQKRVSWKWPTAAFGLALALVFTGCPNEPEPDIIWSVAANSTTNTTAIIFTFGRTPHGLTAVHITVTPTGDTMVATGHLSGSGQNKTLAVTVVEPGNVSISINFPGVEPGPRVLTIFNEPVTWSATANNTTVTTGIDFTFSREVSELLTAAHIVVGDGTGSVTTWSLSGWGTSRSLAVTVVEPGNVSVSIDFPGIAPGPRQVAIHRPPAEAELVGTVTISGDPIVGQTLTAVTDLAGVTFQWEQLFVGFFAQWNSIPGATGPSYVVRDIDVNSTIRVIVTHTGYTGYIVGGPSAVVTLPPLPPLAGTVTISGTPAVGQVLTAITNAPSGATIHWERGTNPISSTGSTYVVWIEDVNYPIRAVVTHANYSGSIISTPTAPVPSFTLSISGDPVIGQTLTAVTNITGASFQWEQNYGTNWGSWRPINDATSSTHVVHANNIVYRYIRVRVYHVGIALPRHIISGTTARVTHPTLTINGTPEVGHILTAVTDVTEASFQWLRGTEFRNEEWHLWDWSWSPIFGATSSTYVVHADDIGRAIMVVVSRDNMGSLHSGRTTTVPFPDLTINGTFEVGEMLTVDTDLVGVSFQWLRRWGTGIWSSIPGETNRTYVVQDGDVGFYIGVVVYRDDIGNILYSYRGYWSRRVPLTISGTPMVGQTLTVDNDPVGASFQWQRGDGWWNWTDISSATDSTYVVQASDRSHAIRVVVTRVGMGSVNSTPTNAITNP